MQDWKPTSEQKTQYEAEGYFILRNIISKALAAELRGVIRNHIMLPDPGQFADMESDGSDGRFTARTYRTLS